MHPKDIHQTTTKAPDSGLRLGFADISAAKTGKTVAAAQNTPSKIAPRPSLPPHLTSAGFEFKFASDVNLSEEAKKLMDSVREEAERMKSVVRAESDNQDRKDREAEQMFTGVNATGRKIANAKGKAGRFSDVHMAQFKKMDSIANHPSSYRAKPNFAQPTQQSLKRSGSKAGLDEPERPRTAGKGTPGRQPPPFDRGHINSSPFKSIQNESSRLENDSPAKKRKSTLGDISHGHAVEEDHVAPTRPSTLPRPKSGLPSSVLTPTKSSLARSNAVKVPVGSPAKPSLLPRSNSVKSLKILDPFSSSSDEITAPTGSPPKQIGLVRSESIKSIRPLPPLPTKTSALTTTSPSHMAASKPLPALPSASVSPTKPSLTSRLPTFQGLKSILRSRRTASKTIESPVKETTAVGTPKRANTTAPSDSGSTKKVDFTPSTKSRYAVKLAAASPSPSKLPHVSTTPSRSNPLIPYDPAAYTLDAFEEDEGEDEWEDAESEIDYPVLPTTDELDIRSTPPVAAPAVKSFTQKAKEHGRRESKEFKSIFTTLSHPSRDNTPIVSTLTDVNTRVNVRGPGSSIPAYQGNPAQPGRQQPNMVTRSPSSTLSPTKPSPSTIRRVRSSGVSNLVQPFEDTIKTVPHGLPGKKRRRESEIEDEKENRDRRASVVPKVPGAWGEETSEVDEGERRGGKRVKTTFAEPEKSGLGGRAGSPVKKPNKAREAAARSARERKSMIPGQGGQQGADGKGKSEKGGRGILSMARLNMLARPRERK
jgi:hypothetical protein